MSGEISVGWLTDDSLDHMLAKNLRRGGYFGDELKLYDDPAAFLDGAGEHQVVILGMGIPRGPGLYSNDIERFERYHVLMELRSREETADTGAVAVSMVQPWVDGRLLGEVDVIDDHTGFLIKSFTPEQLKEMLKRYGGS